MDACPMTTDSAFALHPAAIIRDAAVWRHSCNLMGTSGGFVLAQARFAFRLTVEGVKGFSAVGPNKRALPTRLVLCACAASNALSALTTGTLRFDPFVLGSCSASLSSHVRRT